MPFYEYRCDRCDHHFEALQKFSDQALQNCPACEASGLRKLISASGFRLKGEGWYETDFKSSNKRNLAENAAAPPAKAAAATSVSDG